MYEMSQPLLPRLPGSQEKLSQPSSSAACVNLTCADSKVVQKLFEAQKNPSSAKSKGKGKKKAEPKFNRDNKWLYSKEPVPAQTLTTATKSKPASCGRDTFGLVGGATEQDLIELLDSDEEFAEERVDYFELVPDEVLENILCQLPLLDLCLNVNRVCHRWHDIIAHERVGTQHKSCKGILCDLFCFFLLCISPVT